MSQKTPDYSKQQAEQAAATRYAADLQKKSADEQLANSKEQYAQSLQFLQAQEDYNRGQSQANVDMYAPGVQSYNNALQQLNDVYSNPNSFLNKQYTGEDFQNDPGFAFTLQQGNTALNNSLAAGNGVMSGAAQKAISKYNQGVASQYFNDGFARDQQSKMNQYNALQSLLSQGQFALSGTQGSRTPTNIGSQQAGLATNYGNSLNSIIGNSADAQSALKMQEARTNAYYDSLQQQAGGNGLSSALMGGVMGGVTGFMTGGPWGAVAGAGLGAVSGYMNGSSQGAGQMGNLAGGAVYNYQNSNGSYKGTGYSNALSKM